MVKGLDLDPQSRCRHYHSALDIVAIKMKCCGEFYACIHCHAELADHAAEVWPAAEFGEDAVLCGACRRTLSIRTYLATDHCPHCRSPFNPRCANHYHLYFQNIL